MTEPSRWLSRFDVWSTEPGPPPRIARALVHKHQADNVLLSRIERLGDHTFAAQLRFDDDHPFFFEHPVDHVPGLALIEAGRQTGLAVAHRYYDVPLEGFAFFINDLRATFRTFAELHLPVFGHSVVTDVRRKRGRLARMTFTGHYLQRGRSIGTLTGTWTVVDRAVLARTRRVMQAEAHG